MRDRAQQRSVEAVTSVNLAFRKKCHLFLKADLSVSRNPQPHVSPRKLDPRFLDFLDRCFRTAMKLSVNINFIPYSKKQRVPITRSTAGLSARGVDKRERFLAYIQAAGYCQTGACKGSSFSPELFRPPSFPVGCGSPHQKIDC